MFASGKEGAMNHGGEGGLLQACIAGTGSLEERGIKAALEGKELAVSADGRGPGSR